MRARIGFSLCLVVLVGCSSAEIDSRGAQADIATTWSSYRAALLAGQPTTATGAFFTEDAINIAPSGGEAHGRSAIESLFASFMATTKITALTQATDEVQAVGDLAYERGTFAQTTQQGTAEPQTEHARYLAIWRRQADGKWKCSRFVFNDAPAR